MSERGHDSRRFKDLVYENFARIGKAVGSAKRLETLDLLCQGEKTVEQLARLAQIEVKSASAHLRVLRSAKLVNTRRAGKYVYYSIADDMVAQYWLMTRSMAEHRFAEIDRVVSCYFDDREVMQPLDRQVLLGKARRGDIIVLDVRPADEYRAGHLPHARSVPLSELERELASFPRDKTIIAYCRGPYCVLSQQALNVLHEHGFTAFRLHDGVLEWQAAGLPLVRSHENRKIFR
ncbi:MAG: ArsR/SmtB family transcription factor [Vulcanimicrobiaceae bacterium]